MEDLSKCQRAKKTRLHNRGSLSVQEAKDLMAKINISKQIKEEMHVGSSHALRTKMRPQRYGNYREARHNTRTCLVVVETSKEDDSTQFELIKNCSLCNSCYKMSRYGRVEHLLYQSFYYACTLHVIANKVIYNNQQSYI